MKNLKLILFILTISLGLNSCKTKGVMVKKDDVKASMLSALKWQEANPIFAKAPTDWTCGAYYTCVMQAHKATKDQAYYDAMLEMGRKNKWETYIRMFHADDVVISNAYIYLKDLGNNEVDLKPTDKFVNEHLYQPQDWKIGKGNSEQKILWWWCDALFMAPPLLVNYSNHKKDYKYLDEMHKYYQETYKLLYDGDEKLFARDTRFVWTGSREDKKQVNGKKVFWSRGNGWVIAGLALMLESVPKDYKHRQFYVDLYKEMAERIHSLQPEDGLWRVSLLGPEEYNHGEVSGSGFFTYALAWGVNNGLLDAKKYRPSIMKAWSGLKSCQQADGKVGWVQNIGFDPKPADKDSWQNFGTGAYILAGSEVLKMK
jgi:unsaturated rhamnogalacturonyl hydrolase